MCKTCGCKPCGDDKKKEEICEGCGKPVDECECEEKEKEEE